MFMLIAYLSLFLLSGVNVFSENSKPQWGNQFTDRHNNVIDVNSYCDGRPCLVKCCGNKEVLDREGNCNSTLFYHKRASMPLMTGEQRIKIAEFSNGTSVRTSDIRFILTQNVSYKTELYLPTDIFVSPDGSLKIKIKEPTEQWIEAPALGYCVDGFGEMRLAFNLFPFVFKLNKDEQAKTLAAEQLPIVGIGMLISLFLMLLLIFRIKPRITRTVAPILYAAAISMTIGYILKIVQLYALSADIPEFSECSVFSPAYYFFILSNCVWANVLVYELWWRIWCFRKYKRDFHHKDAVRFILYCLCGWGIPMLMTLAALAVDILGLDKQLPIEKPPFDNCFTNDMQTLLYLHVPIVILTIINGIVFSMLIHQIVMMKRKIYKSPHYKALGSPTPVTTRHRILICSKTIIGSVLIWLLTLLPGIPLLPYVALVSISVYFWTILFFTFVFNKSIFVNITRRFRSYHHLSNKFQVTEFLKEVAKNTSSGTLIKSMKNEDTEKMIHKSDIMNI